MTSAFPFYGNDNYTSTGCPNSNCTFSGHNYSILGIIFWCLKYIFIYSRHGHFMIYHHFLTYFYTKEFFFQKKIFFLFFQKNEKIFSKIFRLRCLLISFETQLRSKFHYMCFKNDEFPLQTENFQKKIFFGKKLEKNFFGKNWFVKKYLAFIKNWWYIIKLHSLVYMKTYFGHQFMIHKMEKKNFFEKKSKKKFFFEKT